MERLISTLGLFSMVGFAWLLSSHRSKVPWRVVIGGLLLQFGLGMLVLRTKMGRIVFEELGEFFTGLLQFVSEGSILVFGESFGDHFVAWTAQDHGRQISAGRQHENQQAAGA